MQVLVLPLSAVVQAVPLGFYAFQLVNRAQWRVLRYDATVELATEEGGTEDADEDQEEQHNHEHVGNVGDGVDEGDDGQLQPSVPSNQSQGPKDPQHTQTLQKPKFVFGEEDTEQTSEHNDKIQLVSGLSEVAFRSAEC